MGADDSKPIKINPTSLAALKSNEDSGGLLESGSCYFYVVRVFSVLYQLILLLAGQLDPKATCNLIQGLWSLVLCLQALVCLNLSAQAIRGLYAGELTSAPSKAVSSRQGVGKEGLRGREAGSH